MYPSKIPILVYCIWFLSSTQLTGHLIPVILSFLHYTFSLLCLFISSICPSPRLFSCVDSLFTKGKAKQRDNAQRLPISGQRIIPIEGRACKRKDRSKHRHLYMLGMLGRYGLESI
ncbi:hypothetical protein BCR39DRAFT_514544 [Naematelia encephala]|uniref:Uncharacterized protein n=1 Tax=Naematelia encephala TaxID=71784 RepID=A0A1Y2BJI9_9TREE|nr:hypothetical protein BCR39DRAFT_514544 [Naematelia encephala]